MLSKLRNRLILSHVLPSVIFIPLMGVALMVVIETQQVIPSLSKDLSRDARLLANLTRDRSEIWDNPEVAQTALGDLGLGQFERTMLLDSSGRLLASTDPADSQRLNQLIAVPDLEMVRAGQESIRTRFSQSLQGEVVDVLAPVLNNTNSVIGVVRLTYHYNTVYDEFVGVRYWVAGILLLGLALNAALASYLAIDIGGSIQRVSVAIAEFTAGEHKEPMKASGPEEIRALYQAANNLFERLQEAERARKLLLANLIHELGRPLGALQSAIVAIRQGAHKNQKFMNELLDGMREETVRLQRLLDDLSHIQDQVLGTLELEKKEIDFSGWLSQILLSWEQKAKQKGIRWETALDPNMDKVCIDPLRLGQSLGNLLSNAIKYTPPGGKVEVSCGTQGDIFWINVGDNGPGIPEDEQEKIFEPFYRGQRRKRFEDGVGLGLGIARDFVIAHGGSIDVESAPGFGSQFKINLPIRSAAKIAL
ncbi:MAG: ATP-binding protein [Anaerolineales bacterium]|jgi:two-component system sensor histidine kinase BaeS